MPRARLRINLLYFLTDILLIIFSVYLPYILKFNRIGIVEFLTLPSIWKTLNLPSLSVYSFVFLFWGIVVILAFNNLGLYGTDRSRSIPAEVWLVFKGLFLSSLVVAVAVFFLKIAIFSRLVFGGTAVSMFLSLSLWRIIKRLIVRHLISQGYHNLNTLVIGAGRIGRTLVNEINTRPYLGLRIIGFLDDNKKGESIKGYEVLGSLSDFSRVVQQRFVEEVLITIPGAREQVKELLSKSKLHNISIKVIPDQFDLTLEIENVKSYRIGSLPVLEYSSRKIHGTELMAKRIMDILLSLFGLILFLPLFIILGITIKFNSPGPVFYVSKRNGKRSQIFNFYKFRSMVRDADKILSSLKHRNETDGPIFKIRRDPRVTGVGRFMRRWSLDELPQLWNVLKGDMSLVGPRPLPVDQVENNDLKQLKRLEIRPGITGLWQIRGRSDTSFSRLIKWDMRYIRNWSMWLDIKIIFRTIPVVFKGRGAY